MMMSHRSLLGSSAAKSTKLTGHWMLMMLTAISATLGKYYAAADILNMVTFLTHQ